MESFSKDPTKATLCYRDESLRAMASGEKEAARYWRLTADAASQIVRQRSGNSILVPIQIPFVDNFVRLELSLQKTHEVLKSCSPNKESFLGVADEIAQKIFPQYEYWMNCLVVSCSHHFEKERAQLLEVIKKHQGDLPQVACYAGQAHYFFEKARQYQERQVAISSIQERLIAARCVSAAYEAAHLANICLQYRIVKNEKNSFFLEKWEAMTEYAKQALALRIKAVEVTEKGEEHKAVEYSLAAFAMNNVVQNMIQGMKVMISKDESLIFEHEEHSDLANQVVKKRLSIAMLQKPNFLFENAASWLESSGEAELKRLEALLGGYNVIASYWQEARDFSKKVARLYNELALKQEEKSAVTLLWCKIKLRFFEKRAKKKIPLMLMEEIFFCMPESYFPCLELREKWEKNEFVDFTGNNTSLTTNAWLYQTGTLLKDAGVNCHFYTNMPSLPCRGILITMSGFLYCYSEQLPLSPSVFIADIPADGGIPHPVAMVHLIPNQKTTKYLPFSEFIPHWSQPFLIPRNRERGERFETVCFMGNLQSIASELCSEEWHARLNQELGLRFIYRDFDSWHDFSDIDAVVAVRDFSGKKFCYKPAHKLHNAWLAGVPFIGGRDSAFVGDGNPGKDYLVADSAEEVFEHLKKLKTDPIFRAKIIKCGDEAGTRFTREAILQSWKRLVKETLPVHALKWYQASSAKRSLLRLLQRWSCRLQNFIYENYKPRKYTFVSGEKRDIFDWASSHQH